MQVESKYKNPDKYIERLKDELVKTRRIARENLERMGSHVAYYTRDVIKSNAMAGRHLGSFRVGDTIIITGEIRKVTEELRRSEIEYWRIHFRRIP